MSAQNDGANGDRELAAPNGFRVGGAPARGAYPSESGCGRRPHGRGNRPPGRGHLGRRRGWASVPVGGVEVHIHHGFDVVVAQGATGSVEAGSCDDGLLIVSAGEALLVDSSGTRHVVAPGQAAVIGATGDLFTVDRVDDDELAGDPWVTANRGFDETVADALPTEAHEAPAVSGRALGSWCAGRRSGPPHRGDGVRGGPAPSRPAGHGRRASDLDRSHVDDIGSAVEGLDPNTCHRSSRSESAGDHRHTAG